MQYFRLLEQVTAKDLDGNLHIVWEVKGKTRKNTRD